MDSLFIHDVIGISQEPIQRCARESGGIYFTGGLHIRTNSGGFIVHLFAESENGAAHLSITPHPGFEPETEQSALRELHAAAEEFRTVEAMCHPDLSRSAQRLDTALRNTRFLTA